MKIHKKNTAKNIKNNKTITYAKKYRKINILK